MVRQVLAGILGQLAAADARIAQIDEDRRNAAAEIRDLGRVGTVDVDRTAGRRFHVAQLDSDRLLAERSRETVVQQVAMCRSLLVEADRDVRVLERLRERHLTEHRAVEEQRSQLELEDAWSSRRLRGGRP